MKFHENPLEMPELQMLGGDMGRPLEHWQEEILDYDLLVGSDGVRSRVREAMNSQLPPGAWPAGRTINESTGRERQEIMGFTVPLRSPNSLNMNSGRNICPRQCLISKDYSDYSNLMQPAGLMFDILQLRHLRKQMRRRVSLRLLLDW